MNSIVEKTWGYFEILKSGKNYLVKKLFIKPGGMLSLQSHNHRSEHWIVAEGKVEVTLDNKVITLLENENIFIPKGAVHKIANKSDKDLIIIEMWYGEILDENDIKRYD
ncbi:phosphomannose isomerase type II C-terminal cupin domain [Pelagibacteraceae bacterium]|nr:phosphomannose isomerase type II C-terminal cupin domain [Pelagibacteraceae bacterium]